LIEPTAFFPIASLKNPAQMLPSEQPESYKDNHFVLIPIKVKACVAWVTIILLSAGYLCYRNKKKRQHATNNFEK